MPFAAVILNGLIDANVRALFGRVASQLTSTQKSLQSTGHTDSESTPQSQASRRARRCVNKSINYDDYGNTRRSKSARAPQLGHLLSRSSCIRSAYVVHTLFRSACALRTVLAPPVDVAWRGDNVFNFGAALTPTQEIDLASLSSARVGIIRCANTMQMKLVCQWMLVIWL